MGYTTDFEGYFRCYRADNEPMAGFLKAILLGDAPTVRVFADWLTDQGDPRGPQVAALGDIDAESADFWRLFGLRPEHAAYLRQFSRTRRMKRDARKAARLPDPLREAVGLPLGREGAYFVGGQGFMGQDEDDSIRDHNEPPRGQPGLWCQWVPSDDGAALEWDGGEKFYYYVEWLDYLIAHFLAPWGYLLNGRVDWQGEDDDDRGTILVRDNVVKVGPRMG